VFAGGIMLELAEMMKHDSLNAMAVVVKSEDKCDPEGKIEARAKTQEMGRTCLRPLSSTVGGTPRLRKKEDLSAHRFGKWHHWNRCDGGKGTERTVWSPYRM